MRIPHALRTMSLAACLSGAAFISATGTAAAQYSDAALQAAGAVSKSQAVAIALAAVGGGNVISAVFEKEDRIAHWSVDIVGAKYENEVWVSVGGSVLRIITQPK